MSGDKKEQQIKPTSKIKDEDFMPSTTTKTVMRNDSVSVQITRIDTYEKKEE